jgi:hypothetical protein
MVKGDYFFGRKERDFEQKQRYADQVGPDLIVLANKEIEKSAPS